MASMKLYHVLLLISLNLCFALASNMMRQDQINYVDYFPGDGNIIITAPHGGELEPEEIPDRIAGCPIVVNNKKSCIYKHIESCADSDRCRIVTVSETSTKDLAFLAADVIKDRMNVRPHIIISNLRRTKLDPNRDVGQAAQGHPLAVSAYQQFHGYIEQASLAVGRGILFDLHIQGHRQNSTELGYVITKDQLNKGIYNTSISSIRALGEGSDVNDFDLVAGRKSFGSMLEKRGFNGLPSPRQIRPGTDSYYRGGYITQTHGSRDSGLVDAIQIETPVELSFDADDDLRNAYFTAVAESMVEFYDVHYNNNN